MAGDWIKVCKETPFKPEVLVIATKLNIHPDIAFARCFQLWSWFDSNTKDGVTSGVTKITLDALLNRDGLCDALVSVGWLCENEEGNLYLPNFDRHNSETAKTRALTNKRQAKHRDKSNANDNATVTHEALPEKRREEKKETKPLSEYSDDFEKFWSIYPKKTGKGGAWKSWKVQKPDINAIVSTLSWQTKSTQWTKDNGQFIPMPATYLNQRRWEDTPSGEQKASMLVCPNGFPFSDWMKAGAQEKAEIMSRHG